jgi:NAD(P)-dependent dehydrogenase (short-subunit alcohol dehydrogenase family)
MGSIVITGCNRGIGAGIARVLLRDGHRVIGFNRTPAEPAAGLLDVPCDAGSAADVARAAAQLPDELTAVVANAGIRRFGAVERLASEDWQASVRINLDGVFYLARATLPRLRRGRGSFIVVGSHAEKYPFEGGAAYCSSKLALRGLVDCLIAEERRQGVRATYLSLGAVRNRDHGFDESWKLTPDEVGEVVLALLRLPEKVLVPYLDARPLAPPDEGTSGIARLQGV